MMPQGQRAVQHYGEVESQTRTPHRMAQSTKPGGYRLSFNGRDPFISSPSSTWQYNNSPSPTTGSAAFPQGPFAIHQSPGKYSRVESEESLTPNTHKFKYDGSSYPSSSASSHYSPSQVSHHYGQREEERPVSTTKQLSASAHTPALDAREKYIIRREAALLAGQDSTTYSRFSEKVAPPAISKKSARKCWIIIASAFLVAILFGVCVGVGITYQQKKVTEAALAAKAD